MDPSKLPFPAIVVIFGAILLLIALLPRLPTPWGTIGAIPKPLRWTAGMLGAVLVSIAIDIYVNQDQELALAGRRVPVPQAASKSSPGVNDSGIPAVTASTQVESLDILVGSKLNKGFDVGVDSSGKKADWFKRDEDQECFTMSYPTGQSWGAVFITVGKPKDLPRPSKDFSAYQTLSIDMKSGSGTRTIDIGIKDNTQPDDGSEAKVTLNISPEWHTYEIPLVRFVGANSKRIYVATEFVFGERDAQVISVRNVRYLSRQAKTGV